MLMLWKWASEYFVCVGDASSWGQSCLPDWSCRQVVHFHLAGSSGGGQGSQPALGDTEATGKFASFISRITQSFLHKCDYHLQFSPSCDWAFPISSESSCDSESNSASRINPSVMASKSGFSGPAMHSNISVPYSSCTVSFSQLLGTQE